MPCSLSAPKPSLCCSNNIAPCLPYSFSLIHSPTNMPQSRQHDDSTAFEPIYYPMNSYLMILQYNVYTTKGIVMAPLLADHHMSEFTIIAIQEPWQNPHILTSHNPSNSSFHLLYPPSADASVCFFVNKSLNPSSYSAAFPTPKYGFLQLRS
jgi:hypothetical protein